MFAVGHSSFEIDVWIWKTMKSWNKYHQIEWLKNKTRSEYIEDGIAKEKMKNRPSCMWWVASQIRGESVGPCRGSIFFSFTNGGFRTDCAHWTGPWLRMGQPFNHTYIHACMHTYTSHNQFLSWWKGVVPFIFGFLCFVLVYRKLWLVSFQGWFAAGFCVAGFCAGSTTKRLGQIGTVYFFGSREESFFIHILGTPHEISIWSIKVAGNWKSVQTIVHNSIVERDLFVNKTWPLIMLKFTLVVLVGKWPYFKKLRPLKFSLSTQRDHFERWMVLSMHSINMFRVVLA